MLLSHVYYILLSIYYLLCGYSIFSKDPLPLCACHSNKTAKNRHNRARIRTVSSPAPSSKLPLSVILSSPLGFESFMAHLTKEFSAENLVAVVEMIQFVDYYYDKTDKEIEDLEKEYNQKYKPMKVKCSFIGGELDIHKMRDYIHSMNKNKDATINEEQEPDKDGDITIDMTRMRGNTDRMKELIAPAMQSNYSDTDHKLKRLHRAAMDIARSECVRENINGYQGIILPSSIPQSTIIYSKENCIKHKIILLCDKYIITDAELELNISACCKDNIISKKDKIIQLDIDECKSIFNQCLSEIYDLMNGSLTRFRVTPEYGRFIEQLEVVQSPSLPESE